MRFNERLGIPLSLQGCHQSKPLVQCQKRVRLLQARTLMVTNAKSVMAAAFEVGYESATQFSRD